MPVKKVSFKLTRYQFIELPEGADDQDAIDEAERRDNWQDGDADDYEVEAR